MVLDRVEFTFQDTWEPSLIVEDRYVAEVLGRRVTYGEIRGIGSGLSIAVEGADHTELADWVTHGVQGADRVEIRVPQPSFMDSIIWDVHKRSLKRGEIWGLTPWLVDIERGRATPDDVNQAAATAAMVGGWSPLHEAALQGATELIEALVAAGADPDSTTLEGLTPLYVAAGADHGDSVRALLLLGADPRRELPYPVGTPCAAAARACARSRRPRR